MAYDIPDEIKYNEKIVANLNWKQLGYAVGFLVAAFMLYRLQFGEEVKMFLVGLTLLAGLGFVFFNLEDRLKNLFSFYFGFRKAEYYEKGAQRFFEIKSVSDNLIHLENGKMLAVLKIQPVNFRLMDEGRKLALITNYKAFLNQLTIPIQILVRTIPVDLDDYFDRTNRRKIKDRLLSSLYSDFRIFEEDFISSQNIKEREYYLIIPFRKIETPLGEKQPSSSKLIEDLVTVTKEKLSACGLETRRLTDFELKQFVSSYGNSSEDNEEKEKDLFNSICAKINSTLNSIKDMSRYLPGHGFRIRLNDNNVVSRYIRCATKSMDKFGTIKMRNHPFQFFPKDNEIKVLSWKAVNLGFDGNSIFDPAKIEINPKENGLQFNIPPINFPESSPLVFPTNFNHNEPIKEEPIEKPDFRDEITPSFDIRKNYAFINDEIHRMIKVVGYPRKVDDGWLQTFLSKNENYDLSLHIAPASIGSMLVYLHNQIIQQTGDLIASTAKGTPNPALEIKKDDTLKVYDSVYKGEEKMFGVSVYLDNHAPKVGELQLLSEKCKSNLNSQMMIPKVLDYRMAEGIKFALPIASEQTEGRDFLTNSLAASFPFISPSNTSKNGILFAHESETLTPLFLDLKNMNNKHFFIIGISGSGKSYTSKYLIMQQLFNDNTKVFVLDPNGEYAPLCKTLGGQVIELSRESTSSVNIFDLAGLDYSDKMLSLLSAFDIIVGGLTESQKGVLNKILTRAYARKEIIHTRPETWDRQAPTFSNVRDAALEVKAELLSKNEYLKDPSVDSLLNRLEMYCQSGLFGFLDRPSKIDVNNGFVCFDLSKLPHAVKNLLIFATLEIVRQEVCKDKEPKIVLIDEGWSLLRSNEASEYILEFIKTSRKFNTSLGFVTQEIEDLLNSKTGKSILNTASVKILMRQNPSNIDLIVNTLKLNSASRDYLLTAQNGNGLLFTEQDIYKFFVRASEKLHQLITTRTEEYAKPEQKTKSKVKISLSKGLYLRKDVNPE